jgi:porphobilinogen synthase
MRRNRRTEGLRRLAQETALTPADFILPLFILPGKRRREAISAMPGVERISADLLARRAEAIRSPAVMIFGVPDAADKDERASAAVREDSLVPAAVRALKKKRPDLIVMTDICVCGYTSHGHCGIVDAGGEVDNDATLELLSGMAKAHAAAGADMVAPSAMADGQVRAIRDALDEGGFHRTGIMAYAAKFASSFYGPFREAAHSAPAFGDRRSYQLPPANRREAIRDAMMDEAEGADWLMVKPAMPYLDVLAELRTATRRPVAAYQVSGEYAMLKFAGAASALDEKAAALEAALCIRRAGADAIITYFAEELIQWITE